MIRALHRGLQIPAEVLVQETQAPYIATGPKPRRAPQQRTVLRLGAMGAPRRDFVM